MSNNNICDNNIQNKANEPSNNSITLSDIVRVLKKNWILILIITLVVFTCGIGYTYGIAKPKFKSTSSIVAVVPNGSGSSDSQTSDINITSSRNITYTICDSLTSHAILDDVATNNNLTYGQLKSMVSISVNQNSFLIRINVTSIDKDLAEKLADEIAKQAIIEADSSTEDNLSALFYAKGFITQVDKASKASQTSPNYKLYLIVSFLAGLVLSLVVVFIKEFTSNKFQTPDEVKVLGLPILNTLVDDKTKKKNKDENSLLEPSVKNFEPYNRLISNVKFANVDNPYKSIMFTSSVMDELKTTVCANFAYTLAHNEKKVVVIDLDTRKPRIHKAFNVLKENGVVEYLAGQIKLDELIKKSNKNVDVITVGKEVSNPVTLLESQKLLDLIKDLKKKYDYVVIDTPPLTACNDASIISKLADAVVFNVAINQGKKKEIKASITQLNDAKANIIGINITKASIKDRGEYYYYEYGDK